MQEIDLSADELVSALLRLSKEAVVCMLDSCGVGHLGSHLLMIAGIDPIEIHEVSSDDQSKTLAFLDEKLSGENAAIFTISYDFGMKLEKIRSRHEQTEEPDIFLALFDCLIIHDYDKKTSFITGNEERIEEIGARLIVKSNFDKKPETKTETHSNFTRSEYIAAVENIQERIRCGDTYQTNLTQRLTVKLPKKTSAQSVFWNLRKAHPAPFAAFISRRHSAVVSASPERFFRVEGNTISTSPIKGTRPRGKTKAEDAALKHELLSSQKDIAENTMIVDLLRNDLGRICQYGSIRVEKLCNLEEHPTLLHLVSTISGELRKDVSFSDILKAVFPSGSITGAPKISTMRIIDEIEPAPRGLSMGAIGVSIPDSKSKILKPNLAPRSQLSTLHHVFDLSVAIRTMTVHNGRAVFNVGGGIVIDSEPQKEYEESLLKAKALLTAIGASEI
jgi:para-aminobenzoate synthetase component 1